jgi:hypothetical protein
VHQPAHGEPDDHTSDRREHEHPDAAQHGRAGAGRGSDEHPEQRQRRRVVDQALATEDRHHPARQVQPAADGQRGDGVRRRDHGAQHQARGQRQARDQPRGDDSDDDGGERHQAHGEQPDRPLVGPDPEVGRVERGRVQQRGQHEQEHDLRVERHLDDAGDQRRRQAGEDEHESGRHAQPAAHRGDGE